MSYFVSGPPPLRFGVWVCPLLKNKLILLRWFDSLKEAAWVGLKVGDWAPQGPDFEVVGEVLVAAAAALKGNVVEAVVKCVDNVVVVVVVEVGAVMSLDDFSVGVCDAGGGGVALEAFALLHFVDGDVSDVSNLSIAVGMTAFVGGGLGVSVVVAVGVNVVHVVEVDIFVGVNAVDGMKVVVVGVSVVHVVEVEVVVAVVVVQVVLFGVNAVDVAAETEDKVPRSFSSYSSGFSSSSFAVLEEFPAGPDSEDFL